MLRSSRIEGGDRGQMLMTMKRTIPAVPKRFRAEDDVRDGRAADSSCSCVRPVYMATMNRE